jgi:hypothetical protein
MAKKSTSRAKESSTRIPVSVDKDSSVSVRQIEKGFIVRESGSTGKGRNQKWYEKEFFSKTNPLRISGGASNGSSSGMKFGGGKK